MDNLTHALVGLLCGEAVVRVRERRGPLDDWVRSAIYAVSIVANNLPDLDFSYARISGKTFGYLLQHRGYTHTLPAALGFAGLSLGALALLASCQKKRLRGADCWLLFAVAQLGAWLHIAMDFANNYGVHPFWPLYDGWFYGDSFFIVEPAFWIAVLAPLTFSYRTKWLRYALWLVLALTLAALWYAPFVPRKNAISLSLLTALLLVLGRRGTPRQRMLLASTGFVLVASSFVIASRRVKAIVLERAPFALPFARTLDVVVTPMPANPFCWSVILVQAGAGQYSARLGKAALWPAWLNVAACPDDQAAQPTAPLRALPVGRDPELALTAEYRVPIAELRAIARERCEASALLRFARVPYLAAPESDGSQIIGDLRYDRKPGLDFSDVDLKPGPSKCPHFVPPWSPPRADILDSGASHPEASRR